MLSGKVNPKTQFQKQTWGTRASVCSAQNDKESPVVVLSALPETGAGPEGAAVLRPYEKRRLRGILTRKEEPGSR